MAKKSFYSMLFMCMLFLPVEAQKELSWENVTALHFAATHGTDKEHALQQYLLLDEAVWNRNRELQDQYLTFAKEFSQMSINSGAPKVNKELDEMVDKVNKLIKEHPEMADQLKEQLKEIEKARGVYTGHVNNDVKSYTYDPEELLRKLTSLAVGKRAYTDHIEIEGGLYGVKTGPRYGPVEPDAFKRPKTPEQYEYTWGVIDSNGNVIIEPKYKSPAISSAKLDIIFLETKDKNGAVRVGARGYDGRVRIPFVYDNYNINSSWRLGKSYPFCAFHKGGKWGFIDFDNNVLFPFEFVKVKSHAYYEVSKDGKNYGMIDYETAKLIVPLKYKGLWDYGGEYLEMWRFDSKIDQYDKKTYQLVNTIPEPKD